MLVTTGMCEKGDEETPIPKPVCETWNYPYQYE